jgi:hypothetical protein
MDATEIRRRNLRHLVKKAGGPTKFAESVGRAPNYITQLQGEYKAFGGSVARYLETQLGHERGWMDRPQWEDGHDHEADAPDGAATSQPVKLPTLTLAVQLATEVLTEAGLALPPPKFAELVTTLYELIEEGLPRAKVLRFARAAVR